MQRSTAVWRSHGRQERSCICFTQFPQINRSRLVRPKGSGEPPNFSDRAEQMGVTVQAVEQHGDPAEIIELHANARAVDLIVMGAERHRRPKWLRRSSITERVLRRSKQPTLVVPSADDARADFENVLVAVDLSPESKAVVEQAIRLAGDDSSRFTIVHAVKGIEAAKAVQSPCAMEGARVPNAPSRRRTTPTGDRPQRTFDTG